ncbi:peptidoglycan recognition protein family protein [Chryseobacterium oncorhynchi]|uniref:N-acetylmuramoyl-L-alanine amidase n=1 Tax=Chryseobacterium oncorhynchi TaxID=741074 RepID=A0A316WZH3_9FLAO|nr:peptidoglycan recognition family protein [Chryseobacterium oncorhynchi]PWN66519.1 hypothetical protein C1638_009205 [Chryseobacterium oncorhynchi]
MAKKGVLKITGNTSPKIGEKTIYKVTEWYPATPLNERKESLITWELFRKRDNGRFTTTTIKKKGIGEFTFGKDAWQFTYRVEGYLHNPERKEPMSIIVQPQKKDKNTPPKEKNILEVKLTYQDGSSINKALSYKDQLRAIAKCQGLEGEQITFSLWEDDEIGKGHNNKNQFITKSPPIQVDSKGNARWSFTLLNAFISIANKREDDKKKHEYYVTAEYSGKLKASDNVNAKNPEYKAPTIPPKKPTGNNNGTKPQPQPKPTSPPPKPLPNTPKGSTRPHSPNNQPDKKGSIIKILLTDKNGKEFSRNPKFGETIKVHIESKNLVGKKYILKIWEHDLTGKNDLLYTNEHTFLDDKVNVLMPLTPAMQKTGEIGNDSKNPDSGEYWKGGQQEIFAEVIFLDISTKSETIDVDIMEPPKKQENGTSPTKKEKADPPKPKSTCLCKQYDLILGNKVDCSFRKKVVEISKELWGEGRKIEMANNLMVIMYFETAKTFSPSKQNSRGFTGLIQFGTDAASDVGTTTDKLKKMSAVEQLNYVKKYFEQTPFKGKINNLLDMYLSVNYPSMIKNNKTGAKNILYSAPSIQYHTNYPFMKESGEYDNIIGEEIINGKKIVKRGFKEGHTYVWEVDAVMKEWYEKYKSEKWNEKCEDIPATEEKIITGGCFQNVVKDGFLVDPKIEIFKKGTTKKIDKDVKIIVLHRTHYNLKHNVKNLITNNKYPVHFWVNGDGKIYQQTSLNNESHHIGVAQKAHTKANKWGNSNSISIEVNGEYLDKNGKRAEREVSGGYWEDVTKEQAQSVACLVSFLMEHYSLSINEVQVHEELCAKTTGEGKTVYNAMLPLLNKK